MRTQNGGGGEIRTRDPLLAKQMLYQLSYAPEIGGLCYKELLVLDIYFVRSTETQKAANFTSQLPSTIGLITCVISPSP